jgi:hypothetical protein
VLKTVLLFCPWAGCRWTPLQTCSNHSGITLKEKDNDPRTDDSKKNNASEASSTSPKRRKVLKTRIDERGREGNTLSHETSKALFWHAYFICLGLLAFAKEKLEIHLEH